MQKFFVFILLLSLSALVQAAENDPLPIEAFASLPQISSVRIAPSGENVAMVLKLDDPNNPGSAISVFNLESQQSSVVSYAEPGSFVYNWIRWANDRQLLVSIRFPGVRSGTPTTETRLLRIDVQTLDAANVLPNSFLREQSRVPQIQDQVVDMLPDEEDHILLAAKIGSGNKSQLLRINLESGRIKPIERGKANITHWVSDRQHRVRIALRRRDTTYEVLYRETEKTDWGVLWEFEAFSEEQVWPLGFDNDPDKLYVRAYHEGRMAVFRLQLSAPEQPRELIYSHPSYDVQGSLIYSRMRGEVIGLRFQSSSGFVFWDDEYQALQDRINAALPGTTNIIYDLSDDERKYVVLGSSNTDPGSYLVGDRDTNQLLRLARRYPNLPAERMATATSISYEARDGLVIEGFLTLPTGDTEGPYPSIIFPHGGPISFDDDSFDYWTQYFASRGFAVLQMNFRGSAGRGFEFTTAGLQNWGLEMQDDVEDGTRWLIESGMADPDRICIVGASYGGYVALLEAARNSELYQCAVSFAGVTDIAYLVSSSRRYTNFQIVREQIGSNTRSLRERSPLFRAEEINIPVLLAHGTDDRRVRVQHSQKMHRAIEKDGGAVTYIEFEDGDHYLSNEEHRVQFFKAMDEFLQANLDTRYD